MMALTVGAGVVFFTFDPETKEFLLTADAIQVANRYQKEYAINASNARHWEAPVQRYIDELLAGKTGPREKTSTSVGLHAWLVMIPHLMP